jgi:hypothetical protein
MIIGISGFIGSGKDTVADYLVNFHSFRRESFAGTLKDAVAYIFGWDRQLLEGRTKESREWREQVDEWWAARLNMPHLTPRWILQHFGTDVCRMSFHDDIWIASLENKLRKTKDSVVISDVRFPNEIKAIRNQGGKIIRVTRGGNPTWYNIAEIVNQGPGSNLSWQRYKNLLDEHNVHPSEYSWVGTEFDVVLENHNTIDELYNNIRSLVLNVPDAI